MDMVSVRLEDAPMLVGPKLMLAGDICMCDWMPAPVSATVRGAAAEGLTMESVPVREPVCVGVKMTCAVQLAPAASVDAAGGHVPLATL